MCSPSIAKTAAMGLNPITAIPAIFAGSKVKSKVAPKENVANPDLVAPSQIQKGDVEGLKEEVDFGKKVRDNAPEPVNPDYSAIRRNFTASKKKKGRSATIATSPLGDTSAAPTQRKTLLGY